jgi:hypothetical protein
VISEAVYYGGAHAHSLPALPTVLTLSRKTENGGGAHFWTLRATSAGLHVLLQDPTLAYLGYPKGAALFRVWNAGVNSIDVQDHLANVIGAIAPGDVATIDLVAPVASAGPSAAAVPIASYAWKMRTRAVLS